MSRHPSVKWAQRSDKLFITVDLPDAKDVKLKLQPEGKFIFSATKDGIQYEVDLELLDKINVEESRYNIGARNIVYVIKKADDKWWSRLIKREGKPPVFLTVDWDKWVDEDEEDGKPFGGYDDMDFSKLDMGEDDDYDDLEEPKDEPEDKTDEAAGKEPVDASKKAKGKEPIQPVAEETKA